jgi:hypothetical protein
VSHNIPLLSIFTIRGKLLCASLHTIDATCLALISPFCSHAKKL